MVIGVNSILDCLELNTPSNKCDVEEFIIRQRPTDHTSSSQLSHLLIDVDTSLERLYGGFHPDWLAGGEWSHLYAYILSLLKTCQELSLCLIFCFDGTVYRGGQPRWYCEQVQQRKKVNQIFKHLKQSKSGVPRRHLWLPPPAFQLCLRTILRELSSPHLLMHQTWGYGQNEHQEQVKLYAKQYCQSLIGIVSSDIEFLFSTKMNEQNVLLKYFSSKHFKLSLKGKLTLVEVKLTHLKERFALNDEQFALLLALLGNHILSESDLHQFHNELLHRPDLGTPSSKRTSLKANGTASPSTDDASMPEMKTDICSPDKHALDTSEGHHPASPVHFSSQSRASGGNPLVSSSADQLVPPLVDYIQKQTIGDEVDLNSVASQVFKHAQDDEARKVKAQLLRDSYEYYLNAITRSLSGTDTMQSTETSTTVFSSSQVSTDKSDENIVLQSCSDVNVEVVRTAFNLHKQGLMMPWIFQCLYKRELTFPITIEPEMCNTIPNVCEFYRPIRKYLYSILFDHKTVVREQVYNSEHGSYLTEVTCEQTSLKHTIEQLWFGTLPDEDRQIRMQTFLQSLHYCDVPKIHSISHEYLLFACILRYIYMEFFRYASTSAVLHIYELVAFISQAVLINELQPKSLMHSQSANFLNQYDQIQIKNYETRPIQLAHLFMRGLETVMFANEVCGAPIHPKYCCPSHFFNGKLFHQKYLQAQYYQQNQDLMMILCDGNAQWAQLVSHLLDVILDRTSTDAIRHTPMQQQQQHPLGIQQQQPQRVLKNPSGHVRTQSLLANSTRPPMRTNAKSSTTGNGYHQQQTPVANYRQQQQPPPVRQAGHMRNGGPKKNNNATPFNPKNHQQAAKIHARTPPNMNFLPQSQQDSQPTNQWTAPATSIIPANHLAMQTQYQQSHTMNTIPTIPLQHQQPINHNFISSLDNQFVHLQIHPSSMMGTPTAMPYPQSTSMINTHMPMTPYTHLYPPPAYTIHNGQLFYHPSPSADMTAFQQPLVTPYHPQPLTMIPGHPPNAPVPSQRTVNFATKVLTNNNSDPYLQRLSPTSIHLPEMNLQDLQQRLLEQQNYQPTPIATHRQMNRPTVGDYTPYGTHRLIPNNGLSVSMQSCHHPSMIIEHQQRLQGH